MRWILWVCLAAVVVAMQTTLAPQVQIGGVRPDWPFLLVVAISLTARANHALYVSAMVGFFVDLNTIIPLGVFTFCYGSVSLLIVKVRELLFRDALLTYVLVTLFAGLLTQSIIALLRIMQEGAGQYDGIVAVEALGAAVYTALWSFPAHWLYLKVGRLLGLNRLRRVRLGTL
jgi:rod shape-determining protein MreD